MRNAPKVGTKGRLVALRFVFVSTAVFGGFVFVFDQRVERVWNLPYTTQSFFNIFHAKSFQRPRCRNVAGMLRCFIIRRCGTGIPWRTVAAITAWARCQSFSADNIVLVPAAFRPWCRCLSTNLGAGRANLFALVAVSSETRRRRSCCSSDPGFCHVR